jgi:hypothetical protein
VELNSRREELWQESKNRLKALVHEAVNVLSNGLHSSDERIAVTSAVHILKTVGLYGEVKEGFGPTAPEKVVWDQTTKMKHEMRFWYENVVDVQKRELRKYKKKLKARETPTVEPVPLTVEPELLKVEDLSKRMLLSRKANGVHSKRCPRSYSDPRRGYFSVLVVPHQTHY